MEKPPSPERPRSSSSLVAQEAILAALQLEEISDFLSGEEFHDVIERQTSPQPRAALVSSGSSAPSITSATNLVHKKGNHHVVDVSVLIVIKKIMHIF